MTHDADNCKACHIIDALDGTVDGHLFNLEHWAVPDERGRLSRLRNWQDVVADKVTSFAGSQVDFESNLQSLIWNVHVAAALNVDIDHVQKLCDEAIAQTRNKDDH